MSNVTAISSYKVFLMIKAEGDTDYKKLIDIKDFPDLGGTPDTLDATTLSDKMRVSILGIQELDTLEFTANYTPENFKTAKALEGAEHDLAVWFGGDDATIPPTPTGAYGKFKFKGELSVYPVGGGVNAVVDMKIAVAATSVIEFVET